MEPDIHTVYGTALTTIAVAGDIDLAGAPAVIEAVAAAIGQADPTGIEVDLAGTTFLDSSGIAGLIRGRKLADAAGVDYRVVGADGIVRRVLEVSGVWEYLHDRVG